MHATIRRRKGLALAVALGAMVIIGALIAGVFFSSTQEYRIASNTVLQARAQTAAEYGLNAVMAPGQWSSTWNSSNPGQTVVRAYNPGDGSYDTLRITKLSNEGFLVVSEGSAGRLVGAQARHRLGAMLTLQVPRIDLRGALTTRGDIKLGGSSFINGNDQNYDGWGCDALTAGKPGLAVADSSRVTTSGCNNYNCVSGNPKISEDPAAADTNTYFKFGGVDWAGLTAMASKRFIGGTLNGMQPSYTGDGSCNSADMRNWGNPNRTAGSTACNDYYPIIHSTGDLQLTGGIGQGVLLVEGNLEVSGGFEFYGPVLVRGSLKTTGQGGHFNGGVMAANVDLNQNTVLGDAVVQYSACAVAKATRGSALPIFAKGRSWVQLFQ